MVINSVICTILDIIYMVDKAIFIKKRLFSACFCNYLKKDKLFNFLLNLLVPWLWRACCASLSLLSVFVHIYKYEDCSRSRSVALSRYFHLLNYDLSKSFETSRICYEFDHFQWMRAYPTHGQCCSRGITSGHIWICTRCCMVLSICVFFLLFCLWSSQTCARITLWKLCSCPYAHNIECYK